MQTVVYLPDVAPNTELRRVLHTPSIPMMQPAESGLGDQPPSGELTEV